ncbi:nucleotide sugar dehydrogenase [Chloroflexota bacterium]
MERNNTIAVIGLGHIGLPIVAAFANSGNYVFGIDIDEGRIRQLQETYESDFYEPGLDEMLKQCKDRIKFSVDYEYVSECGAILITVGTPLKDDKTPNYDYLAGAMQIGKYIKRGCIIILKSTVTPGTTEHYVIPKLEELSGLRAGHDFHIAFCPERVIEGLALHELVTLPKIIGGIDSESTGRAASILGQLDGKIIKVSSSRVAELCKLVDNTYRTMNITFANEIGMLCERVGIDAYEVVSAVNNSYSRTQLFKPGLGADGPCLPKDCQIFKGYARENNVNLPIMDACSVSSEYSTLRIEAMVAHFIETHRIERPGLSIVGLSFKGNPQTDDIRESAATKIYDIFSQSVYFDKLSFKFYDPIVRSFFGNAVCQTLDECVQTANVVMFLTDNPQLMNLDAHSILELAGRPLLLIDCWHNLRNIEAMNEGENIEIFQIGSGWIKKP